MIDALKFTGFMLLGLGIPVLTGMFLWWLAQRVAWVTEENKVAWVRFGIWLALVGGVWSFTRLDVAILVGFVSLMSYAYGQQCEQQDAEERARQARERREKWEARDRLMKRCITDFLLHAGCPKYSTEIADHMSEMAALYGEKWVSWSTQACLERMSAEGLIEEFGGPGCYTVPTRGGL